MDGLVGRNDLVATGRSRLDAALAGAGGLLLLAGEAGIGKTRLLQELRAGAAERGMGRWSAAAFPQDADLSGGLLLDLGHALMRSDRPDDAERGRDLVDDLDGSTASLGGDDADGDAHRRRRLLVLGAVERLLALADDGPALLTLEDLHWCDELSLEVVTHLARRLPDHPLLVVGTLRTEELHDRAPVRAWRSRLLLQRMADEVTLAQLDRDDTEAMVRRLLPGGPVSRPLVDLVHRRSAGVPLLVEELVHAAAEGRLDADPSYVPETLADAVLQRYDALDDEARDVAAAAAVLGHGFDLGLLAAVADRPEEATATALDALLARQLLGSDAPGRFDFRHALLRDVVAGAVPVARRRGLHARIAALAAERPEIGGDAFRSAHHEAAGELEQAVTTADAAAARATAFSAHREALDLLHRAVRCLRDPADPRRPGLLARRGAEAAATDENRRAAEDLTEARALLAAAGDTDGAAALLPGLVAVRHLLGDPLSDRVAALDAELAALPDDGRPERQRVRADLLASRAAAYLTDDALDPALAAAEEALAAPGGSERGRLDVAATRGCVRVLAGDEGGWAELETALARARELGLEAVTARAHRMLGSAASVVVEYDRAERWLTEGITDAERTEQWNHRHYMVSHRAHVAWCTGDWDAAAALAAEAVADGEGGITTRIIALHVTGFLALGRGDHAAAGVVLHEARTLGEEMAELQRYAPAVWGLAESALLAGDPASAVALTDEGHAACDAVGDASNLYPFLVTGTRARLALTDTTGAAAWADEVGAELVARGVPGTLPAVDHAAGLLLLAAGRTGQARARLLAARAGWTARRRWWEAQWAGLDLARCCVASNRRTEAAALVAEVCAEAGPRGATPLTAAADEVGSRLDRHDAPQPWSPLTLRELEVARLVARGLTNREIAEQLRIGVRTAGSHLEHISAKLGASRRTEVAAWVAALDQGGSP